jgi:hypothetical protein
VALAALFGSAPSASAQISLGNADSYVVLGASAVTNIGPSLLTGDLGVSPGSAITGFPPGIFTGTKHVADAGAAQAQADASTAYNTMAGKAPDFDLTGQDLGGLTLVPGTYHFSSSAQLTGQLKLDALGNAGATWIFQIGSTLTTASASSVLVIDGGSGCNVYWQVGSSATLGTTTTFVGNVIALASITLNTGANVAGRALALTGAVTLDSNHVSIPAECLTVQGVTSYGMGCAGTGGFVPSLSLTGSLTAGSAATISLTQGLGGAMALILFGGPVVEPIKPLSNCDCTLYVRPLPFGLPLVLGGAGAGAGNGSVTIVVHVPASAAGMMIGLQAFVIDPHAPCGFANSNALLVTIG